MNVSHLTKAEIFIMLKSPFYTLVSSVLTATFAIHSQNPHLTLNDLCYGLMNRLSPSSMTVINDNVTGQRTAFACPYDNC